MEERYARQTMLPEIGEQGQRRLSEASVLIVGIGGLGSAAALYLTGAGVGRIGLADADTVSKSNLQRQVLYTERQIGMPKSAAARERLRPTPRSNAGRKELPRKTHGLFWTVTT
jgi:molybdopterin/thiamine biosynthesis adenylyltransferase